MHIAYIITQSDSIGGASIHVRDLATAMRKEGHQVTVLVGGNGPFVEMLKERQIDVVTLKHLVRPVRPFEDYLGFLEIKQSLRNVAPDIVAAHSSKAGVLGRVAAKQLGIPVVFTAHGFSFTEGIGKKKRQLYKLLERITAPYADMIIAVSDYDKNLALTEKICDEARITTIHNGIPDIDQALLAHPAKEPPQIIMTARFEIQKDHRTLFNALRQLKGYPWKLKLIGDGPLMDKSKKAAVESGLEERIVFLGSRSDVAEQLAESQIFVLSSHWEGLPISIIEAMRAGLPIVATDVGGCKELVAPGENGFLFPKNDEGALLKVLKELLLDQKERERLGKESRKRFLRSFSFDLMFRATLSVYSEIITRKR